ncbi:uncharacterized protein EHS24_003159 [Apiotrichum porosum]|uniref:Uncharacterized protein n=1 Tax=Apiotrichum porosum TaxID=105984 RepID=A0A427XFC9_9TREE|nr:uncharacterized protein EHS24_003159 [Apiotrichum porosum]RSH77599.1 hypothetical protein EHS24_003159 [Apiotrichum porosum]
MSDNVFRESNAQPTNGPANGAAPPSFLQKKGLLGKSSVGTMSPTDNVMSPISAKLNGAKQRHFQKGPGSKPMPFASKLSQLATPGSAPASPAPSEKKF